MSTLRLVGQHPRVLAPCAVLVADQLRRRPWGDPGEPAGHHRVPALAGDHEAPHHRTTRARAHHRRTSGTAPSASGSWPTHAWGRLSMRARNAESSSPGRLEAQHRLRVEIQRRLQHQLVEVVQDVPARLGDHRTTRSRTTGIRSGWPSSASEIPGRNGLQARALEHAAAEGVDHRHVADPARLEQAGHAELRVGPQLERIAAGGVDPPQDHVDRLEPTERPDPDPTVTHPQVGALHERVAEVGGQRARARRRSRSTGPG